MDINAVAGLVGEVRSPGDGTDGDGGLFTFTLVADEELDPRESNADADVEVGSTPKGAVAPAELELTAGAGCTPCAGNAWVLVVVGRISNCTPESRSWSNCDCATIATIGG
jgi:hypothetical protein